MIKGILLFVLIVGVLYYLFPVITVCETSMYPTYHDGEIILGTRLFCKNKVKKGDIVIYHAPNNYDRLVIKRVEEIKDNLMYCLGDNPDESYDSRNYGYVPLKNLVCKPIIQKRRSEHEQ